MSHHSAETTEVSIRPVEVCSKALKSALESPSVVPCGPIRLLSPIPDLFSACKLPLEPQYASKKRCESPGLARGQGCLEGALQKLPSLCPRSGVNGLPRSTENVRRRLESLARFEQV